MWFLLLLKDESYLPTTSGKREGTAFVPLRLLYYVVCFLRGFDYRNHAKTKGK